MSVFFPLFILKGPRKEGHNMFYTHQDTGKNFVPRIFQYFMTDQ